jgi:hypothetical protein
MHRIEIVKGGGSGTRGTAAKTGGSAQAATASDEEAAAE